MNENGLTRDELLDCLRKRGPFASDSARERLADRMLELATCTNSPGQWVYHCAHLGELFSYPYDTLSEALYAAYGGFETGEEYGICITRDGQVIVGGDLSSRAIEFVANHK